LTKFNKISSCYFRTIESVPWRQGDGPWNFFLLATQQPHATAGPRTFYCKVLFIYLLRT